MILTNARIITFDSQNRVIESGTVEVCADGSIGSVTAESAAGVDLGGRLLMPALINCHTHLYSTFARGMHLPGRPPRDFPQILRKLWWRLDCALNEEDVYYSALVALIDSAKNGVGTVIDHHSSPNACTGSLELIARAFDEVGLRGSTCYEVSDRLGRRRALAGIEENLRRIDRPGAAFGLHASFTLSDRTLRDCNEANASRAPFHVHVAEDRCDAGAAARLARLGILDNRAIAAHCVHASAAERSMLARLRVNVIHNPESNANNRVGVADVPDLVRRGATVGLGSDGYSPRLWDEFKAAAARETVFLNNRQIVKKIWGWNIGRIEPGARADMMIVDYIPPTPLDSGNVFGHLLFGVANSAVDSLMVNGRWVVRHRECVNLDERAIAGQASIRAKALWERI